MIGLVHQPLMPDTSRYRVLHSLGKGGMGEVFLADDTQLGRKVAIKFLADGAANDGRALKRLYREARSAAALDHPFICKIHEITEVDGKTGIVMEHVTGETLQSELARTPLSPKRAIEIASEIAEALEEAHKKRIVHRDLEPANVMLTEQGHVKVMDFGLAKRVEAGSSEDQTTGSLTDPGTRVGTPGYMAPEQLLGSDADERSDIFTFGILFYELLAGVHPFRRSSHSGTMAAILREPHAPVGQYAKDTSETARVTLDRLLAKEPSDRYQSFLDVRTDLRQLQPGSAAVLVTSAAAPSPSGRTPYVGRESERAEARRLLDQAVAGHGGVLLLGGEPGVGKTRLAEEVLLEAGQRGCLALTGRCYETEGTPPFIPWVEVVERAARIVPHTALREALGEAAPEVARLVPDLRRVFPDIPSPADLPPEQQRRYLFNSFVEYVDRASRVTPQVLLIDDLHWADESTLLLLQHVAQRISQMPVLIVGTYRDVDLDVERPFADMLETLTRQRSARRIVLRRLNGDDVVGMLEALSGLVPPASLVKVIYTGTEGNPFFVEEVFHHLREEGQLFDSNGQWRADLRVEDLDVPEGIRLVIGRRVKRLTPDARRVLTTAAVVGRSFDLVLLEAIGDAEGDALLTALEEAEAGTLILTVPSGREVRWEFAHGLIRQTLENSLSLPRRQRAHLRVADAMERVYGPNVERHATDVAQHLYQAGAAADPDKTVRFLTIAGDQALEAGAFDEAFRQFDDAMSVQEDDDPRQTAELSNRKGQALRRLGRSDEALEEWRTTLSAYSQLGDAEGIARTVFDAAWETSWLGRLREAQALALQGIDLLADGQEVTRCRLLALAATWSAVSGDDYEVSHGLLTEAERLAAGREDPTLTVELIQARVRLHFSYMQLAEVLELGPRAVALRVERGELYEACEIQFQPMMAHLWRGELREALQFALTLETQGARVGNAQAHWCSSIIQTVHGWVTNGDMVQAVARFRRALEEAERSKSGPWLIAQNHRMLGVSLFYNGDWDAARAEMETAVQIDVESFLDRIPRSWVSLIRAYAGEAGALDPLLEAASRLLEIPEENTLSVWDELLNVTEGLVVLGRRPEAARLYPVVLRGSRKAILGGSGPALWQTGAGVAAGCGEQWDAAQGHFETALRQAREIPNRIAEPETRRWYAEMLLDRNAPADRDKARTLLGEATEMYRTIGMPKHLEMMEKMSAEL